MQGVHEQYRHVRLFFRWMSTRPEKFKHGVRALSQTLATLLVLGAGLALAAAAPFGPWQAALLRDHPLVGRIFDTTNLAEIGRDELIARMNRHEIVLLGETHDNPDQHRIQAILLEAFARRLARAGEKPPAVVFEMIPYTYQRRLDLILKLAEVDADMVFDAVRWEDLGWPSRELYRPVIEAALKAGAPLIAAGVPRDVVRKVSRRGLSALDRQELRILKLAPLPPDLQAALEREIVDSHCGMLPPEAARKMSVVQRLRDARLALGLRQGFMKQGSAVLIAGNGHVRKDRAAPLYLKRHGTLPPPFVLWQAEASEKAKILTNLLPEDARPDELADAVVVTPRAKREDQCARFERFMKHKRERGEK